MKKGGRGGGQSRRCAQGPKTGHHNNCPGPCPPRGPIPGRDLDPTRKRRPGTRADRWAFKRATSRAPRLGPQGSQGLPCATSTWVTRTQVPATITTTDRLHEGDVVKPTLQGRHDPQARGGLAHVLPCGADEHRVGVGGQAPHGAAHCRAGEGSSGLNGARVKRSVAVWYQGMHFDHAPTTQHPSP